MTEEPETTAHRTSHRGLLRDGGGVTRRRVDAVVVPAGRPAYMLLPAMELAAELGCELVVLCSRRSSPTEAAGLAIEVPDVRWTVVELPPDYEHELVSFATSRVDDAAVDPSSDLSLKRNIGLLLARMVGWDTVFFVDDDMRDLHPAAVRRAAGLVVRGGAAGLVPRSFPDNSIVCHANRLATGRQDVFVTGAALAVDCARPRSFFPRVYNEDWLFLLPALQARRVAAAGRVRQLPYEPFEKVERARGEEFGDVLAEGLMSLLHRGCGPPDADAGFWSAFLDERRRFLDEARRRLSTRRHAAAIAALQALAAAEDRRRDLRPTDLDAYVRQWQADVRIWCTRLEDVPRLGSLPKALAELGLTGATRSREDRLALTS